MLRQCFLFLGLLAATTLSAGGCRSCSNCHDYGPPVANCQCGSCGCHRAGSASGYEEGEYSPDPFEEGEGFAPGGELPAPEYYGEPGMDQPEGVR